MTVEAALFYVFGAVAVGCAVAMVTLARSTVASVLDFLAVMLSLAGIYVLLDAHLVAVLQIILYSGAVLVLLLFTLLLVDSGTRFRAASVVQRVVGTLGVVAALLVGGWLALFLARDGLGLPESGVLPEGYGSTRAVGSALFTDFVVPVEVAGLLLLAAMVGAVFLAKQGTD